MKEMGLLEEIYTNKKVSEIIVDKFDDVYWEENGEIKESASIFKSEDDVYTLVNSLLKSVKKTADQIMNGFIDVKLKDDTRISITLPPISINGPALVIRKMVKSEIKFDDLKTWKCINDDGEKICQKLMKSYLNVILAGSAGSGKTTILNVLTNEIPKAYRVVTVEKTAEMFTNNRKRTLKLETPNNKQHEMKELIKQASLLRADNIIINELEGSEAFEAVSLMRSGHSVLSTMTADGVRDALRKMEFFCMMDSLNISPNEMKYNIGTSVNAVIFQERLPSGKRVMSNIGLVKGVDEKNEYILKPLFYYDEESEKFITTDEGKKYLE